MIEVDDVSRTYGSGTAAVHALHHVSLTIACNDYVSIMGPSGCGKSTLLNVLGTLDSPTSGSIRIDGIDLHGANDQILTEFRRTKLGFVFQFFHLLPTLNILENTSLPLLLAGRSHAEAEDAGNEMLSLVGMSARARHMPHQLSGGETQRAAIARALAHKPSLVLADEPTGNLDTDTAEHIMRLFSEISQKNLTTLIIVTHSESVAAAANRHIRMRDGNILSDSAR